MFKKILVPLDGSGLAARILPQVEDLAKSQQSEVVLLTVGDVGSMVMAAEALPGVVQDMYASIKASAEKNLAAVAATISVKGIKVSTQYREGLPAQDILEVAIEEGCDLIAMATHGRGELSWVLGSVAEKVLAHATVPVLLLRVMDAQPIEKKKALFGAP
ncbi:MAG: UspA domain-containing protein [Nitrospirae bacterium]|nr:MAG: UspA domain-containing protein [Nitrospirota bacterium]